MGYRKGKEGKREILLITITTIIDDYICHQEDESLLIHPRNRGKTEIFQNQQKDEFK